MKNPLFSILIANYNNGKFFKDCYNSIISQTYQNWEVIIVDDGSTDDSVLVIKEIVGDDARFKFFENDEHKNIPQSIEDYFSRRESLINQNKLNPDKIKNFLFPDKTTADWNQLFHHLSIK